MLVFLCRRHRVNIYKVIFAVCEHYATAALIICTISLKYANMKNATAEYNFHMLRVLTDRTPVVVVVVVRGRRRRRPSVWGVLDLIVWNAYSGVPIYRGRMFNEFSAEKSMSLNNLKREFSSKKYQNHLVFCNWIMEKYRE